MPNPGPRSVLFLPWNENWSQGRKFELSDLDFRSTDRKPLASILALGTSSPVQGMGTRRHDLWQKHNKCLSTRE